MTKTNVLNNLVEINEGNVATALKMLRLVMGQDKTEMFSEIVMMELEHKGTENVTFKFVPTNSEQLLPKEIETETTKNFVDAIAAFGVSVLDGIVKCVEPIGYYIYRETTKIEEGIEADIQINTTILIFE